MIAHMQHTVLATELGPATMHRVTSTCSNSSSNNIMKVIRGGPTSSIAAIHERLRVLHVYSAAFNMIVHETSTGI